jgi:O-methyltransferase domain
MLETARCDAMNPRQAHADPNRGHAVAGSCESTWAARRRYLPQAPDRHRPARGAGALPGAGAGSRPHLVEYRAGDVLSDPLEKSDAALLSNILHHFTPGQVASVLSRVRSSLRPRGTVNLGI